MTTYSLDHSHSWTTPNPTTSDRDRTDRGLLSQYRYALGATAIASVGWTVLTVLDVAAANGVLSIHPNHHDGLISFNVMVSICTILLWIGTSGIGRQRRHYQQLRAQLTRVEAVGVPLEEMAVEMVRLRAAVQGMDKTTAEAVRYVGPDGQQAILAAIVELQTHIEADRRAEIKEAEERGARKALDLMEQVDQAEQERGSGNVRHFPRGS